MQVLIAYALQFVGIKYFFGGDDPVGGFDCSGLVGELLLAAGVLPFGTRLNAQGLYDRFSKDGSINQWGVGALVFYGSDLAHVSHVGFCLDSYVMIEAGGGDSTTTTDAEDIKRNAFVKVRPIKYRRDFLCVIKPGYRPPV